MIVELSDDQVAVLHQACESLQEARDADVVEMQPRQSWLLDNLEELFKPK